MVTFNVGWGSHPSIFAIVSPPFNFENNRYGKVRRHDILKDMNIPYYAYMDSNLAWSKMQQDWK